MQTIFAFALAGFLLLVGEVFVPGMVLGTFGSIFFLAAVCRGYVLYGPLTGTWIFATIGIFYSIGLLLWLRFFPRTAAGRRISNRKTLPSSLAEKHRLVGVQGIAISVLRPAGVALIEGQRRDVITDGSFIEPNTPLIVIAEEGQKLVVRAQNSYEIAASGF
ncbi:MAG: hypothetical protein C5B47_00705 [Verrucomicrobia bacterium]|nr:MAG: hypothetical protein C5B47_00705 [Verrucomicrobiota bacterium]